LIAYFVLQFIAFDRL